MMKDKFRWLEVTTATIIPVCFTTLLLLFVTLSDHAYSIGPRFGDAGYPGAPAFLPTIVSHAIVAR